MVVVQKNGGERRRRKEKSSLQAETRQKGGGDSQSEDNDRFRGLVFAGFKEKLSALLIGTRVSRLKHPIADVCFKSLPHSRSILGEFRKFCSQQGSLALKHYISHEPLPLGCTQLCCTLLICR